MGAGVTIDKGAVGHGVLRCHSQSTRRAVLSWQAQTQLPLYEAELQYLIDHPSKGVAPPRAQRDPSQGAPHTDIPNQSALIQEVNGTIQVLSGRTSAAHARKTTR